MMKCTDHHCRFFYSLLSTKFYLFTEMIPCGALIYNSKRLLKPELFKSNKVILQLGGSKPEEFLKATYVAKELGFEEVNINCGCPSPKVQKGNFGVSLMLDPPLVSECFSAVNSVNNINCSIKNRLGIGHDFQFEFLKKFISYLSHAGCNKFYVHARNAILEKFSTKDNQNIPPLNYEYVYDLKKEFNNIEFILNGGLNKNNIKVVQKNSLDGLMFGRAFYDNPWFIRDLHNDIHSENKLTTTRFDVIESVLNYSLDKPNSQIKNIFRHMFHLFKGLPLSKIWKRTISEVIFQKKLKLVEEFTYRYKGKFNF